VRRREVYRIEEATMKTIWRIGLATVGAAALAAVLTAQARQRQEVSLLGVRVFATVQQVLRIFGNPTMITNMQVSITEIEGTGQQQGGRSTPRYRRLRSERRTGRHGRTSGRTARLWAAPAQRRLRRQHRTDPHRKRNHLPIPRQRRLDLPVPVQQGRARRAKSARMGDDPTRACAPAAALGSTTPTARWSPATDIPTNMPSAATSM
jgi:hypothetical protein